MKKQSAYLFIIPLFFAVGFAVLMFYLAVISTEKAREHYRAKKFNEKMADFNNLSIGRNNPALNIFNTKTTPTPTPTPPPEKTKSFLETAKYYEASYLILVVILLIFGSQFLPYLFNKLPKRNSLQLSRLTIRCVFLMCCSFVFCPAFFILYIWLLRNGFL